MMTSKKYVAYVGIYTQKDPMGIHVYDLDPDSAVLRERSKVKADNVSDVRISSDGQYLYATVDQGLSAYHIDGNGDLEFINTNWIGGMRGHSLCLDSKRRYAFVGGFHDGRVTMMRINADGSVGDIADGIFHQRLGFSSVEKRENPHVTSVVLTPNEKYLCAVDKGIDQVKIYEVDYERGKLKLENIIRCPMNSAPRTMAFGINGKQAYILTETTNTVMVLDYREDRGAQFDLAQELHLFTKAGNAACADLELSADGKYLYVSVDARNSVACNAIDDKGRLTWIFTTHISGDYPKELALLPGGDYYLVLNHDSDEIRSFHLNHEKNYGLMKNKPIALSTPNCILIHEIR